ncbi:MAG: 1-(5-phosphoribosyl)-5-[(5-phosphoribosylamino)methylideneamino]imidazole-4-carboxamide isomerase [Clostridia bacterium]
MYILPAIDIKGGKCVRLYKGDFAQTTVYHENPTDVALDWQAKGAKYLHLVDLDGAIAGKPSNLAVVQSILQAVKIPVEIGGGIRSMETIETYLTAGVDRVILGTVAVKDPNLARIACERFGSERIVLGLDAKEGYIATEGWLETSGINAIELALQMKELGIVRIIYTDISKDGTLTGVNVQATKELAEATGMHIIASGGVASIADIQALLEAEATGIEGVIVGKAIYTGSLILEEALAMAERG